MPVKKAKGGYRYGKKGKLYRGKGPSRRPQSRAWLSGRVRPVRRGIPQT